MEGALIAKKIPVAKISVPKIMSATLVLALKESKAVVLLVTNKKSFTVYNSKNNSITVVCV